MQPEEFARECRETARNLRRLPLGLRYGLRNQVKNEVAEPIAQDIRSSGRSVYARRVAPTTRVRAAADPMVVVGGAKRVASGGARGRDLVFGTNFGGGERIKAVPRPAGERRRYARGYRRHSTHQFRNQRDPFVFRTIGRNLDQYLELWAGVVDKAVNEYNFAAEYERQSHG